MIGKMQVLAVVGDGVGRWEPWDAGWHHDPCGLTCCPWSLCMGAWVQAAGHGALTLRCPQPRGTLLREKAGTIWKGVNIVNPMAPSPLRSG